MKTLRIIVRGECAGEVTDDFVICNPILIEFKPDVDYDSDFPYVIRVWLADNSFVTLYWRKVYSFLDLCEEITLSQFLSLDCDKVIYD